MAFEQIYLEYGLNESDWLNLARLTQAVSQAGIKLEQMFSSRKDKKAGIDLLFSTPAKHAFMLSLNSRDKYLYCKVHRNMDLAAEGMMKDQIANWEMMVAKMINYH